MRLSVVLSALLCAGGVVFGVAAAVSQDEEDVRGAFLTSRPKDKPARSETATKPSRRRPKPAAPDTTAKTPEKKPSKPAGSTEPKGPLTTPDAKPLNVRRIGLGLTLFTRDSSGLAVRVDPEHVFREGDRVRVLLETNSDGYLYIFNTTNEGPPAMIYPDPNLDEAGNYFQSHVPFEIPSGAAAQERLRWLVFDQFPGTERLFFVFTREPLKGVPIEDELISHCRGTTCPWRPPADLWEQLQKQSQAPLKRDKSASFGKAQTDSEHQATTRGIGLAKDDPEPSLIMMASSTSPMLVATLDLIHK